jgi:hypothetical protein
MQKLETLKDYLEECGYKIDKDINYYPEFIFLERSGVVFSCH